jgi:hypothetical protein
MLQRLFQADRLARREFAALARVAGGREGDVQIPDQEAVCAARADHQTANIDAAVLVAEVLQVFAGIALHRRRLAAPFQQSALDFAVQLIGVPERSANVATEPPLEFPRAW